MNVATPMHYFEMISRIPRASFNEKAVSDAIKAWAEDLGLSVTQDAMWNLIIIKEATEGYEDAPTVMLQSHLDMVAEKNKDSQHNFDTDPIELIVGEDGFLRANKTTLGADDGAGVAYMMALLGDNTLTHPKLECVFTVQEETGLTGAEFIDLSALEATLCIGLDGSGETETYVSSSGGARGIIKRPIIKQDITRDTVTVSVRGLMGGHSGESINKERASATKLAAIIARRALDQFNDLRIVTFDGGTKMNAITRESDITFALDNVEAFTTWFTSIESEFKTQYEHSDAGLSFELTKGSTDYQLSKQDSDALIDLVFMLPYGMFHQSMVLEDLPIASANLGTVDVLDQEIVITISVRATQTFVKENIMKGITRLTELLGFSVEFGASYPGWNFDAKSPFRNKLFEVYQTLRGETMTTVATHGGMELGIWKDKMPALDIVSFGPIMYDIHTPEERMDIASFERTYEFLVAVLASLDTM